MNKPVVLLTGASGGLGTAIAQQLSNRYVVYGTSRNPKPNKFFIPIKMDLNQPDSIAAAVAQVLQKEGKIDVLINNAGIGITGSIEETDMQAVKQVFQTNFFGMMELIQAVLPGMRQNKNGLIINISSIAGYTGLPFRGIYSATKAAVMRMTEALSAETASQGIKVVDIAPGDFRTHIAEGRIYTKLKKDSPYFEDYKRILKMIDEEVENGLQPVIMGKTIDKILTKNKPKLRYNIGLWMQKITPFLTTCLPGRFFEKLIRKHYKMK